MPRDGRLVPRALVRQLPRTDPPFAGAGSERELGIRVALGVRLAQYALTDFGVGLGSVISLRTRTPDISCPVESAQSPRQLPRASLEDPE